MSITFRLKVSAGLRRVSEILNAFFLLGLELGVWTAQHLMNAAIKRTAPNSIKLQAHQ